MIVAGSKETIHSTIDGVGLGASRDTSTRYAPFTQSLASGKLMINWYALCTTVAFLLILAGVCVGLAQGARR